VNRRPADVVEEVTDSYWRTVAAAAADQTEQADPANSADPAAAAGR